MCRLQCSLLVTLLALCLQPPGALSELSPSLVAKCPAGYIRSLHRQFDTCVVAGPSKFQDARITAYSYRCQDSRSQRSEFRNVLRVTTNGNSFRGRFNMHIFTNDDEHLQDFYSCIAFDRSDGLILANFTHALPEGFFLLATFGISASYCHPAVVAV